MPDGIRKSNDWGNTWYHTSPTGLFKFPDIHLSPGIKNQLFANSEINSENYIPDVFWSGEGGYHWTELTRGFYFIGIGIQRNQTVLLGTIPTNMNWTLVHNRFARLVVPRDRPVILRAGYDTSHLGSSQGGKLRIICLLEHPDDSTVVELTYDGVPLGLFLNDDGQSGDRVASDGEYSIELVPCP